VSIRWLSPQELAALTQRTLYIHDIVAGETIGQFPIPECTWGPVRLIWGMVYLEDKNEFLVGTSVPDLQGGQESHFVRCQQPRSESHDLELLHWEFTNLGRSLSYSGQLSSPTLVGKEIACITPASGVQSFNTRYNSWAKNPPLLDAATSVAVSLGRNLVAQTKDSIQIFSVDVLESDRIHNGAPTSHVYRLGEKYIVCLQPDRCLTLLELETLKELRPLEDDVLPLSSLAVDKSNSARASFGRGLVAEFGVPAIVRAWRSGSSLPQWMGGHNINTGGTEEDAPLCGWSPERTWVVIVHSSPQPELRVKDTKRGVTANLPLEDDDLGTGEVYDVVFYSETRFYLKIDGPGRHVQIPHRIISPRSGSSPHTITKGKPVLLSEPRPISPYTLDENCEWVIDAKSRKICWISPGDVRRGDGGHFWAGLSLVMVGEDGVVRELTFKEPDS